MTYTQTKLTFLIVYNFGADGNMASCLSSLQARTSRVQHFRRFYKYSHWLIFQLWVCTDHCVWHASSQFKLSNLSLTNML